MRAPVVIRRRHRVVSSTVDALGRRSGVLGWQASLHPGLHATAKRLHVGEPLSDVSGCLPGSDEAHRDPHDEPGKLLIFERAQAPEMRTAAIPGIERLRRHRDESAEQAGVHQRGEGRADGRTDVTARPRHDDGPPEEDCGADETRMLECGFYDLSHFDRAFRHRFGITLGGFRARHATGPADARRDAAGDRVSGGCLRAFPLVGLCRGLEAACPSPPAREFAQLAQPQHRAPHCGAE
jgi:hypothetical protein